jgi:hypothetical protein
MEETDYRGWWRITERGWAIYKEARGPSEAE